MLTNLDAIRAQYPSLSQTVNGYPAVFFDGPGGTQVPQRVIDAISDYLGSSNANTNGAYATSQRTNIVIDAARAAMADLFNSDPDEVVFGPNMTTLTYAVSRAMGRELKPGDEILLTHLRPRRQRFHLVRAGRTRRKDSARGNSRGRSHLGHERDLNAITSAHKA